MSRAFKIDIVSDVVCPWCFIGTRRLMQALAKTAIDADIEYQPFLLQPDTPPGGDDLRAVLKRKYGGDPARMFVGVERAAKDTGIALHFANVTRSCNTIAAHTLLGAARALGTQAALAQALFAAYFLEGNDIGDVRVLTALADAHGFAAGDAVALLDDAAARKSTLQKAQQAATDGITGVPFFILDGRVAVHGAQPVEHFVAALEHARAAPAAGEMNMSG